MTAASTRTTARRTHAERVDTSLSDFRLSVIIVSFNCRDLLANCLDSLAQERLLISMEVHVVDNASTDGTQEMLAQDFDWVQASGSDGNIGFARANNIGLQHAHGEYILLLNPDTVVPRGALLARVDVLEAHQTVGMLGCKLVKSDGTLDHACKRGFPTPASALYHFFGLTRLWPTNRRFGQYTAGHIQPDEAALVDAINGAFMLVRRDALDQVGGLDEDFWMYMEDLDWCYRFAQAGWPVLYWPDTFVVHAKAGSSGRYRSWRVNRAFHHGMWLFYRKHYSPVRSPIVTGAVWSGIWLKFLWSATQSSIARRSFS